MQSLEAEFCQHQAEVEKLNQEAEKLEDGGKQDVLQPTLLTLNHRWRDLQTRWAQYHPPTDTTDSVNVMETVTVERAAPVAALPTREDVSMDTDSTATPEDNKTVVTTITTITTRVTKVTFSEVPVAQYIENLEELSNLVGEVESELQSPILQQGLQYEEFSKQEDKLKVSKVA